MAILNSNGILTVSALPTHEPTSSQARFARLQNTFTFYYYDGTLPWKTLNLDFLGPYTGNIITDNSTSIHTMLQDLETAIGGVASIDGNLHTIIRTTDVQPPIPSILPYTPVAPTVGTVPAQEINTGDLTNGDSAIIYFVKTNGDNWGFYERWVYQSNAWTHVIFIDFSDYVSEITILREAQKNTLTPVTQVGQGTVNGTPTILQVVDYNGDGFAGLMTKDMKTDLDNALQDAVDSDTIDFTTDPVTKSFTGVVKIGDEAHNVIQISVDTTGTKGLKIVTSALPFTGYTSHAAATADGNLASGSFYSLTVDNIEGVASNSKGPMFRKA